MGGHFLYRTTKRAILLFALPLAPLWASGQGEWSVVVPIDGGQAQIMDAVELPTGGHMALFAMEGHWVNSRRRPWLSWLVPIDVAGNASAPVPLEHPGKSIVATAFVPGMGANPFHVVAAAFDSLSYTGHGIVHFMLGADGLEEGSAYHVIDDGLKRLWCHSGGLDASGNIVVPGGAYSNDSVGIPHHLVLMRMTRSGTLLSDTLIGTSPGAKMGRHVIADGMGVLVSMEAGGSSIGPTGITKFLRYDTLFQYVGGFVASSLSGSGTVLNSDSIMRESMYMTSLPGGSIITSGRFGNISPMGMRTALVRFSPQSGYEALFLPRSVWPHDYCAAMQGQDMLPDGNIVHAMLENFTPYPPFVFVFEGLAPSRIRVHRMDTMLNVLCEFVVDGFEENAYYFLNRVKATKDGGALLMGSRQDMGVPGSRPQGWIMKLGPDQCHTSIPERPDMRDARVFPNPGTDGFTAILNGPVVDGGLLSLYDGQGRLVGIVPVQRGTAQVGTAHLAPGMYHYRITDRQGTPLAAGRWVRE